MAAISLILFDLNGVLYSYNKEARIAHLASLARRSSEDVRKAIWDSGFEDAGDAGVVDAEAYLRGFGERLGYCLAETEWLEAQRIAVAPIAASLQLLPCIRPPARCAVLTNNNLLVRKHSGTLYPEAAAMAGEGMYVSAQFGARKPSAAVYRRCLARIGLRPDEVLFVDDDPGNVAGAQGAGLAGLLYAGPENLAAELGRRALLVEC